MLSSDLENAITVFVYLACAWLCVKFWKAVWGE